MQVQIRSYVNSSPSVPSQDWPLLTGTKFEVDGRTMSSPMVTPGWENQIDDCLKLTCSRFYDTLLCGEETIWGNLYKQNIETGKQIGCDG